MLSFSQVEKNKYQFFPTTQWSLVVRASGATPAICKAALAALLERYGGPMRAHLTFRKRIHPHEVEDLVQEFITKRMLEAGVMKQAEQSRGRFRNFLLSSLEHFVANQFRERRARKRAPDKLEAIDDHFDAADDAAAPGETFDVQWARAALQDAVGRMRQACESSNRPEVWGIFCARLLEPTLNDAEPEPYEKVVARLGLKSPAQACNVLVTAKRMFIRILREVVGEYAGDESEIDEEIADLRKILAQQSN